MLSRDSKVEQLRNHITWGDKAFTKDDVAKARELGNHRQFLIGVNYPIESLIEDSATGSSALIGVIPVYPKNCSWKRNG